MHFYKVFNFCLASEIELPALIPTEGKADISIKRGKVGTHAVDSEGSDCILGEIPGVARFLFYDGQEIIVDPIPGVDESLLQTTILGPALCLLLEQRGLLVLHASCINVDGYAVAFLGGSGWGKSTLATAFHRQGYDVLTDDVMPVKIAAGQAVVLPSYPQFKVSPEALASLGQDVERLLPVYTNSQKLSYAFTKGFQESPLPLTKIYVLKKGNQHEIVPIESQEAFSALVCHTRTINLLKEHKALIARHFQLCTELMSIVSFNCFTRKPALEDLPALVELVKADIAKTNSCKLALELAVPTQ